MSAKRIDSILNSIPGYAGYRSKEKRRDSDRLLRERLAEDYGQRADRLGRLATRFADERDLAAVSAIGKPHSRLVAFRDRVRSATYGYTPLFAETEIDEAALDQIAAFDGALADGLEPLTEQIAALEREAPGTEQFTAQVDSLAEMVEGLHERFDSRSQIIESGTAMEPQKVAALLEPGSSNVALDRRPTAYNLHDGDALTFDGKDYTVIGRVTLDVPSGSWRDFQLDGGRDHSWLRVPASASGEFLWLQKADVTGDIGSDKLQVGDASFELEQQEQGSSEVIGKQGAADATAVRYFRYRPFSGDEILHVYDWGADTLALRGSAIDPIELKIWSREGGDAV